MNLNFSAALSAFAGLLLTTSPLQADNPDISPSANSADELIQKGDAYYDKLQAPEALKCYLPAEKLDPKNVRLLVRISREYRHEMSDATSQNEKMRLGRIGVDYAERAVCLAPNNPDAQLAIAISYGKILPLLGNKEKVEASRHVKDAADKVVKLDPSNDLGWHVKGRCNLVLSDLSGVKRAIAQMVYGTVPTGTLEDAATCFEKAIKLNPNRLMHYIELGRTFAEMGRANDARQCIKKGLTMRETEKDDPETKRQGRELLAKLN